MVGRGRLPTGAPPRLALMSALPASMGMGGMYGAGSDFADAVCKSNQYARDANARGEHCVLYCRVTMGAAYRTRRTHQGLRRPPDNRDTPGAPFDSIFAEARVAHVGAQTHNEFVVFHYDQVYREYYRYIVWYTIRMLNRLTTGRSTGDGSV
jgi:hypothetical protein